MSQTRRNYSAYERPLALQLIHAPRAQRAGRKLFRRLENGEHNTKPKTQKQMARAVSHARLAQSFRYVHSLLDPCKLERHPTMGCNFRSDWQGIFSATALAPRAPRPAQLQSAGRFLCAFIIGAKTKKISVLAN
jgi:hypothetical protein